MVLDQVSQAPFWDGLQQHGPWALLAGGLLVWILKSLAKRLDALAVAIEKQADACASEATAFSGLTIAITNQATSMNELLRLQHIGRELDREQAEKLAQLHGAIVSAEKTNTETHREIVRAISDMKTKRGPHV